MIPNIPEIIDEKQWKQHAAYVDALDFFDNIGLDIKKWNYAYHYVDASAR